MSAFTTQRWQFYLMSNSAKRFGLRGRRQLLDLSTNIKWIHVDNHKINKNKILFSYKVSCRV